MADMLRFVRADLRGLKYHGVESMEAIAAEVGIAVEQLVKLNANENIYGAPAAALIAVQQVCGLVMGNCCGVSSADNSMPVMSLAVSLAV